MELFANRWNCVEPPEKDRIVFLHGMGGVGALWRAVAIGLEKEFSILAPDQRGHGKSQLSQIAYHSLEQNEGFGSLEFAEDIFETMNLNAFSPAWLAGHSMGMRSACAVAHYFPEAVKGLILIDLGFAGPAGGGMGDRLGAFLKAIPHEFASREEAKKTLLSLSPDESMAQYLLAVLAKDATTGILRFPFHFPSLFRILEGAKNSDVAPWLHDFAKSDKPILVMRGENSSVFSREEFLSRKKEFASYSKVEFLEMPGTSHGLPFEKRLEFVAAVREYIMKN